MKKVLLFFSIVAMGLSMNSCLDGNTRFSDIAVCYVTSDDVGTVYGRASTNIFIKTNEMGVTMLPGEFKYFVYNWDEEFGMLPITVDGKSYNAYNMQVNGTVLDIDGAYLSNSSAPVWDDDPNAPTFTEIGTLTFDTWGNYMDDRWVNYCSYKIKKGQSASISFHYDPENPDYEDDNYIYVHVDLNISGTPEEGASESVETKLFAVRMSTLRASLNESKSIKYRYYVKNGSMIQSTISPDVLNMQIEQ